MRRITIKVKWGRHGFLGNVLIMSSGKVLGSFFCLLNMGRKDKIFGRKVTDLTLARTNV